MKEKGIIPIGKLKFSKKSKQRKNGSNWEGELLALRDTGVFAPVPVGLQGSDLDVFAQLSIQSPRFSCFFSVL